VDISERASIGGRVGYFYNPDGVAPYVAGPAKNFADITLTAQINVIGGLKLMPEYRFDFATDKVFLNRKGEGSKFQNVLGLAAVYAF
jgi:hypothetical protein